MINVVSDLVTYTLDHFLSLHTLHINMLNSCCDSKFNENICQLNIICINAQCVKRSSIYKFQNV